MHKVYEERFKENILKFKNMGKFKMIQNVQFSENWKKNVENGSFLVEVAVTPICSKIPNIKHSSKWSSTNQTDIDNVDS